MCPTARPKRKTSFPASTSMPCGYGWRCNSLGVGRLRQRDHETHGESSGARDEQDATRDLIFQYVVIHVISVSRPGRGLWGLPLGSSHESFMRFSRFSAAAHVAWAWPGGAQSPFVASHFLSCSATKSGAFTCRTPRPIRLLITASPSQSIKQMFSKSRVSRIPSSNTDSADSRNNSIHWPVTRPSNCRVISWFDDQLL